MSDNLKQEIGLLNGSYIKKLLNFYELKHERDVAFAAYQELKTKAEKASEEAVEARKALEQTVSNNSSQLSQL